MKKMKKLYELYLKQSSYRVAGNEWSKPLAFHVWLSQVLRKPDPENPKLTVPMTYLRAGREISIREHAFICQGARSGKGELMENTVDVLTETAKRMGTPEVLAHYMHTEPTVQFLVGGNEDTGGKEAKKSGSKWRAISGRFKMFSLIAWGEATAIVSPKSTYGDFKHLILAATDDSGRLSLTARKDLVKGDGEEGAIPSFETKCSVLTGSVYKDSFALEILQSGLLQRFLFSYYVPSFEKNLSQLQELTYGLITEVGEGGDDAKEEFFDYFMKNIHGHYVQEPVEWTAAGAETLSDLLGSIFVDPSYRGQKLDTYNSFANATQKHIEKIASAAAIVDGVGLVNNNHVEYAWTICKPVFYSYLKLLRAKFLPDLSEDDRIRFGVIKGIVNKEKDGVLQRDLLNKLKIAKKLSKWDLGESSSYHFIKGLEKSGALQARRNNKGKGKYYRVMPM